MAIFDLKAPWAARRSFAEWFLLAIRSKLEPMKRVARTLRRHWDQVENHFRHRITNVSVEASNTQIPRTCRHICARPRRVPKRTVGRNKRAVHFDDLGIAGGGPA